MSELSIWLNLVVCSVVWSVLRLVFFRFSFYFIIFFNLCYQSSSSSLNMKADVTSYSLISSDLISFLIKSELCGDSISFSCETSKSCSWNYKGCFCNNSIDQNILFFSALLVILAYFVIV